MIHSILDIGCRSRICYINDLVLSRLGYVNDWFYQGLVISMIGYLMDWLCQRLVTARIGYNIIKDWLGLYQGLLMSMMDYVTDCL